MGTDSEFPDGDSMITRKTMRITTIPIIATIVLFPNKAPFFCEGEAGEFSPDFFLSEFCSVKTIAPINFVKENEWYLYFLVCLNFFIFRRDHIIRNVSVFLVLLWEKLQFTLEVSRNY
jgi:hypothetical protein